MEIWKKILKILSLFRIIVTFKNKIIKNTFMLFVLLKNKL